MQNLIKRINDQTDLASLAQSNSEFQEVRDGATSIDKNLKSKIYKNYDEVNNAISQQEQKIEELIQKWKNIVESQTQDIKNILSLEIDKACKQADICSFVIPSSFGESFIKSTCEELNSISLEFLKFNERKSREYQLLLNDIRNFNDKAEVINSKINELNVLTSKIEESINEYRINVDTNNCDSAIAKLIETKNQGLLAQDKDINSTIGNCQVTYNEAEQINNKQKAQTLSGLKKFFFKIVNVFISKKKFDKLLLYDKKTEPEKPTPLELSVDATNSLNSVCKRFGLISKTTANLKEALTPIGQELKNVDSKEIKKIENECCIFGQCKKCCIGEQCSLDSSTYPVVLVHGFSVWAGKPLQESIDALNKFQDRLVDDGFVKVGILLPNANMNEIPKGEWGKGGLPVTVRTTYYINVVNQDGKVYGVIDKNRGIKDYAKTLSEIVDLLKYRTGKDKVNIIAFSMGGLVSRSYIKDGGASNVNKLITIGTPNNGVYDIDGINFACGLLGQNKECVDLNANNDFIKDLKTYDISKSNIKVITVAGKCGTSSKSGYAYDNVVRVESVALPGVTNYVVECKDPSKYSFANNFHGELVVSDLNPQVYNYVKEFLKNG
ncbi:alpha/beta hydrolase [Candidatus Woesearchaeota archaeon]|nr:alpha/beta hydrolase [Candidatus Woesearchaeota archaeon]